VNFSWAKIDDPVSLKELATLILWILRWIVRGKSDHLWQNKNSMWCVCDERIRTSLSYFVFHCRHCRIRYKPKSELFVSLSLEVAVLLRKAVCNTCWLYDNSCTVCDMGKLPVRGIQHSNSGVVYSVTVPEPHHFDGAGVAARVRVRWLRFRYCPWCSTYTVVKNGNNSKQFFEISKKFFLYFSYKRRKKIF
jgi:hypothetical protein